MYRPLLGTRKSIVNLLGRALKRGVVPDCKHGLSTRGNSEESRRPTRKSPKNKELFRIAYMDHPRVGTQKSLVDRLGRALKQGVVLDFIHGSATIGRCLTRLRLILPCKSDCHPIFGFAQFVTQFTHV